MRFQAGIQIFLIIVAVIIVFTVIKPEFEKIQDTQNSVAEINDAIKKADPYLESLKDKIGKAESFPQSDLVSLNRFIPETVDTVKVARDIEVIIAESGLLLQNVKIGDGIPVNVVNGQARNRSANTGDTEDSGLTKGLQSYVFTIDAIGSYERMKIMLEALERNAYPLQLTKFEFASENGSILHSFKLELRTFSLSNDS